MRNELIQDAVDRYVYLMEHFKLSPPETRISVENDYELTWNERVVMQSKMLIELEKYIERSGQIEQ